MVGRLLILLAAVSLALAQGGAKESESQYGIDLKVRKASEAEFDKNSRKFGVEVYTEGETGNGLFVAETGSLAVVPAKLFSPGDSKPKDPLWLHGVTLKVRPVGQTNWATAKKCNVELYKDETSGTQAYINEAGILTTVPSKYTSLADEKAKPKDPKWLHALNLHVRKAGEKDIFKARRLAVEVFRDENNGNLVYITGPTGVAVVPGKLTTKDDTGKDPVLLHGLVLKVRKQGEKDFTDETKRYGIEVYLDENSGNQLYVCETGAIAVVPAKFAVPTEAGTSKSPVLKRAMDLQVRKPGRKDFDKDSPRFGVEVYRDEKNGNLVYLSETGDLAVVGPKAE